MTNPAIQLSKVEVSFPSAQRATSRKGNRRVPGPDKPTLALEDFNLSVPDGEFVSLIGPSGCGKSTALKVLAGLVQPSSGTVEVDGEHREPRAGTHRATALMPQSDCLLPWRRALPNALLGARIAGVLTPAVRARAEALFVEFGLAGFEAAWPSQLSGGMRQRLALLRTVLTGRPILLLDEPFAALDPILRRHLNLWLSDIWRHHNRTTVLVTHDVDEALLLSDRILVMSGRPGKVIAEFTPGGNRTERGSTHRVPADQFSDVRRQILQAFDSGPASST